MFEQKAPGKVSITFDTDFDNANVEFLEFWMMDPFLTGDNGRVVDSDGHNTNNTTGGDLYINLGFGNNVSNWNISLTPQAFNKSGAGALCLPTVQLPAGLARDGQNASIQFVMGGGSGNALYNVSLICDPLACHTTVF